MLRLKSGCAGLFGLLLCMVSVPLEASYGDREDVQVFLDSVADKHGLDRAMLGDLLKAINKDPRVIKAITQPAETKPWRDYRPIFLTDSRIEEGVKFWTQHQDLLAKAEKTYGVPPAIVVAIIGVETRYGRYRGRYPVLDALVTLAFDYPPRSRFFKRELEAFLLLTQEEGLDANTILGSYAGALGMPQFISSSYREYAVDFDGDGTRDLFNSTADVIGSVANYFKRHGWTEGEAITSPATVEGDGYRELLRSSLKPAIDSRSLMKHGVSVEMARGSDDVAGPVRLFELAGKSGPEFWVGYHNFYVITRYNHSQLYALAAFQLSEEIRARRTAIKPERMALQ